MLALMQGIHRFRAFFWGTQWAIPRLKRRKLISASLLLPQRDSAKRGLRGVGIANLMTEAGLTVGGFYKHFDSRDDLVAEAVGSALGAWERQVDAAASGGPPVTYESLVDDYLSEAHRDQPGTGCPVVALAGDIARSDKRT